jgi:hypothetical protein
MPWCTVRNRGPFSLSPVRRLLLVYAALNAVLYSTLLPLWEGFDEPFHFGYVQQLANGQGFPDARNARLSREVWEAILRAPASDPVKANLPAVVTYSEYFSWPPERRSAAQRSLRDIPRDYRWQLSNAGNYEAHHAPLAYILLAVPERLLAGIPLPPRVLILRIIAALAGSFLLCTATVALCSELSIGEAQRNAVLFCVLSSQMTWATLARVSNDWLAVPLAVWTLVFMIRSASSPTPANLASASLILSAGLLTKAYFLALVPVLSGISAIRGKVRGFVTHAAVIAICAGPWYFRNYRLYHVLTGMQEARAGVGPLKVLGAAFALHWPGVMATSVRAALWTANNTFRNFSLVTMNLVVAVCTAAFLLWIFSRHTLREWVLVAYCAAFTWAIAYAAVVMYVGTADPRSTPSAWYAQVLVAPILTLLLLGTARWPGAGKVLAIAIALLFGYVLAVTYVFKLIPLYAGYQGRGSLRDIAALYLGRFHVLSANLNSVALGPAPLIFALTCGVILLILALEILLVRGILASCTRSSLSSAPGPRPSSSARCC